MIWNPNRDTQSSTYLYCYYKKSLKYHQEYEQTACLLLSDTNVIINLNMDFIFVTSANVSVCFLQAYPEYLITYQILKPESAAQSAAGAEQKS